MPIDNNNYQPSYVPGKEKWDSSDELTYLRYLLMKYDKITSDAEHYMDDEYAKNFVWHRKDWRKQVHNDFKILKEMWENFYAKMCVARSPERKEP